MTIPEDASHGDDRLAGGGETILLLDDEGAVLDLLEDWLGTLGYRVLRAEFLEAALEVADGQTVDVAIADVMMGVDNGVEIVRRLREGRPELPVVFISGLTEGVVNATPNTYFVRKPFSLEGIAAAVRHALDHTA
jgi:DNA-binding response OmpR family regulator